MTLPTGNTNPALEDLDLPATIFPIFEVFPPLIDGINFDGRIGFELTSNEPVLDNAFFNLLFCFLWIGAWTGSTDGYTIGTGALLSNKLSGILDTAYTIVELL